MGKGYRATSAMDHILLRRMNKCSSSDPDALVEHLRSNYPDYARIKLIPFSHRVRSLLLHHHHQPATSAEKKKKKKRRLELRGEEEEEDDSDKEGDAAPQFDVTKSMLRDKYCKPKTPTLVKELENAAEKPKRKGLLDSGDGSAVEEPTPVVPVASGGTREGPRFRDFGGIKEFINDLEMDVIVPLCHPHLLRWLGIHPMSGILLHGPPGCGKTMLARAIANETGVPFFMISATEVVSGISGESEGNIRELFKKAYRSAPSIVFIDEIDAIASKRENMQKEMERRIVTQLMTCMDESHQMLGSIDADSDSETSAKKPGYVLVIGATNRPDAVDPALRRPGRFDKEIMLGVPDVHAKVEILKVLTSKLRLDGTLDLSEIARCTSGFVGADLRALVDKAGNIALRRIINRRKFNVKGEEKGQDWWKKPWEPDEIHSLGITMSDFEEAVKVVQPSLRREGFSSIPDVKWEDVGGLDSIQKEFERSIVQCIKNPDIYEELGMTSETGFLLYGPPGCGKTLIAKAVAHEAGANFIHIKGPEILNKYVGESESDIRRIFSRSRTCAPCILFFDEIDALTTKRGNEGGSVVERLLNQLLVELDGADERRGVHVIGATNILEVVDPAILRPGRLGKVMYVPLPGDKERKLILKALVRKKPVAADVDLDDIAGRESCGNLSGADLADLVNEAAMVAVEERLEAMKHGGVVPLAREITYPHFEKALKKVSPSVSEEERKYYQLMSQTFRRF